MNNEDRELRELFARLREEDRARIPSFRAPAAREAPRWMWAPRIAIAAAIVLITLVLAWPDRPRHVALQSVDLGAAAWPSPTDFLLITPGSELLRTVPAVGSPDDWTAIDLRGRLPAPESTRSERTPS
jgi:hypothetical protein